MLEAVLKQARTTRHPWLLARDANMCPEICLKSASHFKESRCRWWLRSKRPRAGRKAQKVSGSEEAVEDFEPRPHKAVSFVVERDKEEQEWNEQKLPEALLGYGGGRLPGRSTKEKTQ